MCVSPESSPTHSRAPVPLCCADVLASVQLKVKGIKWQGEVVLYERRGPKMTLGPGEKVITPLSMRLAALCPELQWSPGHRFAAAEQCLGPRAMQVEASIEVPVTDVPCGAWASIACMYVHMHDARYMGSRRTHNHHVCMQTHARPPCCTAVLCRFTVSDTLPAGCGSCPPPSGPRTWARPFPSLCFHQRGRCSSPRRLPLPRPHPRRPVWWAWKWREPWWQVQGQVRGQ